MKIRIKRLKDFAGVTLSSGMFGEPSSEYEVPDEEGATLCAEGLAEPVAEVDDGEEHAVVPDDAETRGQDVTVTAGVAEASGAAHGPGGEPFDPGAHNVPDVVAYLERADEAEARRVLDAEAAGKARAGLVGKRDEIMARFADEA